MLINVFTLFIMLVISLLFKNNLKYKNLYLKLLKC